MSSKFFKEKGFLHLAFVKSVKKVHKSKINVVELIEVIVDYEVLVD